MALYATIAGADNGVNVFGFGEARHDCFARFVPFTCEIASHAPLRECFAYSMPSN